MGGYQAKWGDSEKDVYEHIKIESSPEGIWCSNAESPLKFESLKSSLKSQTVLN